jgi:uncharacterized protein (TIRG00374 family)
MAIPRSFRRKLLVFMGLGSAVFLVLALLPERGEILAAASSFDWKWLPVALGLALLNYTIRAVRWHWYLHHLEIPLTLAESIPIFLIGLMLSVTPGKAGELFKAYLVKLAKGVPMSRTAPVVVVERLTDLTGTLILVTLSLAVVQIKGWMVALTWVLFALGLLALSNRKLMQALLALVGKLGPQGLAAGLGRAYDHLAALLSPVCLIGGTLLSALAWFAECISLLVIMHGFGASIGWIEATFIYTLSTLAGAALFFLPGGIGGTEATMVGMLREIAHAPAGVASLATVLTRVSTLWFAAAIGFVALFFCPLAVSEDVDAELQNEPNIV